MLRKDGKVELSGRGLIEELFFKVSQFNSFVLVFFIVWLIKLRFSDQLEEDGANEEFVEEVRENIDDSLFGYDFYKML